MRDQGGLKIEFIRVKEKLRKRRKVDDTTN